MSSGLYRRLSLLWDRWGEMCQRHPSLQKRCLFVRPFLKGMDLEIAFAASNESSRLLLAMQCATIGWGTQESQCGIIGPTIEAIQNEFAGVLGKVLAPANLGEELMIKGVVSIMTILTLWGVSAAMEPPRGWNRRLDPLSFQEAKREARVYEILFLAGSGLGQTAFRSLAEAMEKGEKKSGRAALVGWAYTLSLALFSAKAEDPEIFGRVFDMLQPRLLKVAGRMQESFEEAFSDQERESSLGGEWRSALQMFRLACEKGDAKTLEHFQDTLLSLLGCEQQKFREDLTTLRDRMQKISEIISHALSRREDVVTGIIQTA